MRQAGESAAPVTVSDGAVQVAAGLLPRRGALRLTAAAWQVVAGWRRHVLQVVAHDGRQGWEFELEADGVEALRLWVFASRHPLRVRIERPPPWPPGRQQRAALRVPLTVRVVGCSPTATRVLVELPPAGTHTAWLGSGQGYQQTCGACLTLEPQPRPSESSLLVPVLLRNAGARMVTVDELPLHLAGESLRRRRGGLVARARRMVADDDGRWHEQVRQLGHNGRNGHDTTEGTR